MLRAPHHNAKTSIRRSRESLRRISWLRHLPILLVSLFLTPTLAAQDNWPNWRGPDYDGTSKAVDLPASWSETDNICWKVPLPFWSGASPVIWGDRIFITSPNKPSPGDKPLARKEGNRDPGGPNLLLLCLSRKDGSLLWQRELASGNRLYRKQNMSSPSPVTDGAHVWVLTGTGALTAFDMDGNRIWLRDIQKDYGTFGLNWGYASSPLLLGGKVIVQVLHGYDTDDPSYLVAFDPNTGKTLWKVDRPTDTPKESPDAYTTPTPLRYLDRTEIVVSGGGYVTGHDPETGREIWRAAGLNPTESPVWRIVGSPVAVDGMVYAPSRKKPLLALKAGGKGLVTDTHLAWKTDSGPDVPSPVTDGKYLYILDDGGMVSCLDAKTGKPFYEKQRIARGTYSASPLLADGRIYATSESGTTTVLTAGPTFKIVSTNQLDDDYVLSSIAVSGGRLFIRGAANLYCIGRKSP